VWSSPGTKNQPAATIFKNKLERRNIRVYTHQFTKGYPTDVDKIVSDEGYGANEYIHTSKPIVVVTGPGPYSGKLANCLSQIYHEYRRGVHAGYAKFETSYLESSFETSCQHRLRSGHRRYPRL